MQTVDCVSDVGVGSGQTTLSILHKHLCSDPLRMTVQLEARPHQHHSGLCQSATVSPLGCPTPADLHLQTSTWLPEHCSTLQSGHMWRPSADEFLPLNQIQQSALASYISPRQLLTAQAYI